MLETDFLTQDDLARRFQVSKRTLALWRSKGSGPRFVRVGGQIRYRSDAVSEWITERESLSTAGAA